MKFKMLTAAEKHELRAKKLTAWHKWFAWKPIRLTSDDHTVIWLEFVYRKGRFSVSPSKGGAYWSWKYADSSLDILKLPVGYE